MSTTELSRSEFRALADAILQEAKRRGLRAHAIFQDGKRPALYWMRRGGQRPVLWVIRAGRTRKEVLNDMLTQLLALHRNLDTLDKAALRRSLVRAVRIGRGNGQAAE